MAGRLILARHAESAFSARQLINAEPSVSCALTKTGRAQARRLRHELSGANVELCVTSEFGRARETADLALEGRDVPRLVLPALNDPPAGVFESKSVSEYLRWLRGHDWTEAVPGGGESQLDALRRYTCGYQSIVERSERVILVIGHALSVSFALSVMDRSEPALRREYPPVECARLHSFPARRLEGGLARARRELVSLQAASSRAPAKPFRQ